MFALMLIEREFACNVDEGGGGLSVATRTQWAPLEWLRFDGRAMMMAHVLYVHVRECVCTTGNRAVRCGAINVNMRALGGR